MSHNSADTEQRQTLASFKVAHFNVCLCRSRNPSTQRQKKCRTLVDCQPALTSSSNPFAWSPSLRPKGLHTGLSSWNGVRCALASSEGAFDQPILQELITLGPPTSLVARVNLHHFATSLPIYPRTTRALSIQPLFAPVSQRYPYLFTSSQFLYDRAFWRYVQFSYHRLHSCSRHRAAPRG